MSDMNFSLTTFNKSGKLQQIENALNRVSQGKMALGIKATNGVVIACDKKVPTTLVDLDEYQKIQSITPSTGFVYAGMGPDFRLLGMLHIVAIAVTRPRTLTSFSLS
jgi:20S proteasome subunit alpha 2